MKPFILNTVAMALVASAAAAPVAANESYVQKFVNPFLNGNYNNASSSDTTSYLQTTSHSTEETQSLSEAYTSSAPTVEVSKSEDPFVNQFFKVSSETSTSVATSSAMESTASESTALEKSSQAAYTSIDALPATKSFTSSTTSVSLISADPNIASKSEALAAPSSTSATLTSPFISMFSQSPTREAATMSSSDLATESLLSSTDASADSEEPMRSSPADASVSSSETELPLSSPSVENTKNFASSASFASSSSLKSSIELAKSSAVDAETASPQQSSVSSTQAFSLENRASGSSHIDEVTSSSSTVAPTSSDFGVTESVSSTSLEDEQDSSPSSTLIAISSSSSQIESSIPSSSTVSAQTVSTASDATAEATRTSAVAPSSTYVNEDTSSSERTTQQALSANLSEASAISDQSTTDITSQTVTASSTQSPSFSTYSPSDMTFHSSSGSLSVESAVLPSESSASSIIFAPASSMALTTGSTLVDSSSAPFSPTTTSAPEAMPESSAYFSSTSSGANSTPGSARSASFTSQVFSSFSSSTKSLVSMGEAHINTSSAPFPGTSGELTPVIFPSSTASGVSLPSPIRLSSLSLSVTHSAVNISTIPGSEQNDMTLTLSEEETGPAFEMLWPTPTTPGYVGPTSTSLVVSSPPKVDLETTLQTLDDVNSSFSGHSVSSTSTPSIVRTSTSSFSETSGTSGIIHFSPGATSNTASSDTKSLASVSPVVVLSSPSQNSDIIPPVTEEVTDSSLFTSSGDAVSTYGTQSQSAEATSATNPASTSYTLEGEVEPSAALGSIFISTGAKSTPSAVRTIKASTAVVSTAVVSTAVVSTAGVSETVPQISNSQPPESAITSAPESVPGAYASTTSTSNWVPTRIIADTDTGSILTAQTGVVGTSTSGLPRAITPATETAPGANYDVVTIGFKQELNYPFVVQHDISSAQIFQYLPSVLTYSFTSDSLFADVSVKRLVPYTAQGINYVITVAEIYFPYEAISSLQSLVLSADSKLYNNPDPTSHKLALIIDPRIPLTGLETDSPTTVSVYSGNGSIGSGNSSSKSRSGTVGGVVAGASIGTLAYMALMVLLFKRYKKKKSVELPPSDSESNLYSSEQTPASFGSDGTRPPISNPVNAQNSLGWSN